jgi:hypothetical protein
MFVVAGNHDEANPSFIWAPDNPDHGVEGILLGFADSMAYVLI